MQSIAKMAEAGNASGEDITQAASNLQNLVEMLRAFIRKLIIRSAI
ncbi:MAG: hypothetical protein ACJA0N_001353 [Pseudohongiellaceae bacterium]|jgi:hypothetical protein